MSAPEAGSRDDLSALLRTRLATEPDVLVAYLFGSVARGTDGPRSDVDVAVLIEGETAGLSRELELGEALAPITAPRRVDVIVLNGAPVTLAYRVLRDGRLLVSRDESARIRHWADTVDRYLDTAPMRRLIEAGQRRRLEMGTYGRR